MSDIVSRFNSARRVSTPIIVINSPDPMLTVISLSKAIQECDKKPEDKGPIVMWDCIRGWVGVNDSAKKLIKDKFGGQEDATAATNNAIAAIEQAEKKLPRRSVLFVMNAHQGYDNPNWIQAVWNCRDEFKRDTRMLVLLTPGIRPLPPEIASDCMIFDEELPTLDELGSIVVRCMASAGVDREDIPAATMDKTIDALCGLAAFPAEQTVAMSMTRVGTTKQINIDLDKVWDTKRKIIENTPGLSVWRGGENFDKIGGYDNVKKFMKQIIGGKRAPRGIVFMDEIEKAFAGSTGGTSDSSGVSQAFLGTILSYMQDKEAAGVIFIGPPGSGKSAIAKATGNTAGIPTISFDLSGMKNSLVGASEANLRSALKVVTAVTQGRCLFVATCNQIAALPPELRRRFTLGTFYFPLPNHAARRMIWDIYLKDYSLDKKQFTIPDDSDWTGAEIKQCCDIAERTSSNLVQASEFIVPVARSAAKAIQALQEEANGRFISAEVPGFYSSTSVKTREGAERAISLED